MSINRFDRTVPKDWSWQTAIPKFPELNFEAFDKLLGQQQQQYDSLTNSKQLSPDALQTEGDLAIQQGYRKMIEDGSKQVSEAFLQSPSAGNLAYKNYINRVKKAWQPGGEAYVLNKRYQGYYEGKKAIDDYYKDEVNPAYKEYAYNQLQEQVKSGPKYDPNTGSFQVVNTPELFKSPNLRKTILDTVKEIDESGDTQFLGNTNKDFWIQKIKSTGKSEEKLKLAAQALMEQPEFANELKVEQWYQTRDGRGQKAVEEYKNQQTKQLESLSNSAKDAAEGKNTKDWQEFLIQQGYDVNPNGKYDDKTKKAGEDFLTKQNNTFQQNINNPDIESVLGRKNVEKGYMNYAASFANKKVDKELIFNRQKEVLMKDARDRDRTNAIVRLNDTLAPVVDPDVLVAPAPATNVVSSFDLLKDVKKNKNDFEKGVAKTLTQNPNSIFNGWTLANVAEAQRLFNETPTALNGKPLSEAERQQLFEQKLRENSSFGFTPSQVKDIYNGIKTDTGVNSSFEQLAAMDHAQQMLEDHTNQISKTYLETPEGKERFHSLAFFRNPGESDSDLMARALSNPEQFKPNQAPAMAPGYVPKGGMQNVAEMFKTGMKADVKKLQKQGVDFKTENAWAIHAGNDDKFLKPVYDNVLTALNSQVEGTFASEGLSGLVFRNLKGEEVDGKPAFKTGSVTVGADNKPVFRAVGVLPGKNGKPGEAVSTEITLNEGNPITMQLQRSLKKELAQNAATKNWVVVEGISKVLNTFDTKQIIGTAQEQATSLNGVSPQPLRIKDADGNDTTTDMLGFKTKKISTKNYGGVEYHTYVGQDLTGNKVFFRVVDGVDPSGNLTGQKFVLPLRNGKKYTSDVSEINVQNMADEIISETPVERTVTKVPSGAIQAITND